MRARDRELASRDVEHELAPANELERADDHELPALDASRLLDSKRETLVIGAMRAILEHRHMIVNDLQLPQRELRALEALKTAVSGRDGELSQFVYASDRSLLLEQALAILQPSLISDLDGPFADLVERVGNLRHDLRDLDDAQDELQLLQHHHAKGSADTGDKPKPKPDPGDPSLDGPERNIATLPSTLDGPEVTRVVHPTTLTGPDVTEPPKAASTLDGPAIADVEPPPTTLGSAEDLAAAAVDPPEEPKKKSKPWWKRPFGG